ncbi:MAG TPA: hypothetical protein VIM55_18460 [Mucilaginibacter sp.]
MTVIEIKTEIQKEVDKVPENLLPQILEYIKEVRHQSADEIKMNKNLEKILSEDKGLFERLAK